MCTVFVSHPAGQRAHYFGDRAIAALRVVADVRVNASDAVLSSQELATLAHDCEIIIACRQTVGDEALFFAAPQLWAFVRCAVDIRNVDVLAASRHGVMVTQASAGYVASVSEWIIGMMINLSRHITAAVVLYQGGQPVLPVMGCELRGATLGVIGYGQIGQYLCDVALALGMRVVVHDPFAPPHPGSLEALELAPLLQRSDYVVCLATATEATENMMDCNAFALMRRSAFFINASRGNLVNEADLLAALDAGVLAGCALDVGRAPDQMPSPQVAAHPRVLATPHIGGLTRPAIEHQALETAHQVVELLQGRAPQGAVNAQQAWRWQRASLRP